MVTFGLGSGISRFEASLCHESLLGDSGPIIHSWFYLPHMVDVRIKWRKDVSWFESSLGRKSGNV